MKTEILSASPSESDASGNVAVFCGHMFNAGSDAEKSLAQRVSNHLNELDISVGYGPLACGADIVIAEALLARGAVAQPWRGHR